MFVDDVRHDAYAKALRQSIRPGDVVLDIGTGMGVYAMLAAKLGAGHVYAVEPNDLVKLGQELADANGLGDRIDFIQAISTEINLPTPVDVIFADLRGVLPFYGHNLPSMRDAHMRFLRPGGIMIPTMDIVYTALASNPLAVQRFRDVWIDNPFDLDLSRVVDDTANHMRDDTTALESLMSDAVQVAQVDYHSDLADINFAFEGEVEATTTGTVDGLCAWFEATLLEGITYSTKPGDNERVYGMAFFPFQESVDVEPGTKVSIAMSARFAGDDYIWDWTAAASDRHGSSWAVDHSTMRSVRLDPDTIRRRKASHRIATSSSLEADQSALRLLGEGQTLGEVASALLAGFPSVVADTPAALARVADLAARYDH